MNVWLKWLDCCFIVDGVELMQEVPRIYCLLVVEGLAEIQGDPLSRSDDALDTIPTHLAFSCQGRARREDTCIYFRGSRGTD